MSHDVVRYIFSEEFDTLGIFLAKYLRLAPFDQNIEGFL